MAKDGRIAEILISGCRVAEIPLSSGVAKFRIFIKYWLPPLAWMFLIFSASADSNSYRHSSTLFEPLLHWLFPQMPQARVEFIHYLFRKAGHLTEFALLALLLWRAVRNTHRAVVAPECCKGGWRWEEAGLSLSIILLYAASDEIHQAFVATRSALISDVFVDTSGGAVGLTLLCVVGKIFKRW